MKNRAGTAGNIPNNLQDLEYKLKQADIDKNRLATQLEQKAKELDDLRNKA